MNCTEGSRTAGHFFLLMPRAAALPYSHLAATLHAGLHAVSAASHVRNPLEVFTFQLPPCVQDRMLYVLPAVQDTHEVVVTFQLPPLTRHYQAKAEHYISHLVGHEGPGSLLSLLKVWLLLSIACGRLTSLVTFIAQGGAPRHHFLRACCCHCSSWGCSICVTEPWLLLLLLLLLKKLLAMLVPCV